MSEFKFSEYKLELGAVATLSLLLLALDIWVNAPSVDYQPKTDTLELPQWLENKQVTDDEFDSSALQAYFNQFETEKVIEEETDKEQNELFSQKAQSEQRGLLSTLYIGDFSYRLIAISSKQDATAVLLRHHINENELSRVNLSDNDILGEYTVTKIDQREITLVAKDDNDRTVFMRLFVPSLKQSNQSDEQE